MFNLKIFLNIGDIHLLQICFQVGGVLNQVNASPHGGAPGDLADEWKDEMIADGLLLTVPIKYPGTRVGNIQKLKQGCLFDFVLYKFITMVAGERGLAHGIK